MSETARAGTRIKGFCSSRIAGRTFAATNLARPCVSCGHSFGPTQLHVRQIMGKRVRCIGRTLTDRNPNHSARLSAMNCSSASETQKRKTQTQAFKTQTKTQPKRKPVSKRNQNAKLQTAIHSSKRNQNAKRKRNQNANAPNANANATEMQDLGT